MLSPAESETWLEIARALGAAPQGQREALVLRYAQALGVSKATAYRRLGEVGWSSGRKPRCDKGESKLDVASAERVALYVAAGVSKKGQMRMPVNEAVVFAQERGELPTDVGYSTITRRLRHLALDRQAMTAHKSTIQRRSSHPNHVWVVDVSVALAWTLKDVDGKRLIVPRENPELLYEGKRERLASIKDLLLRYVAVDHLSGAWFVRYYYEPGENAVSMVDFLLHAFRPKSEVYRQDGGSAADAEAVGRAYPFRGIPRRILADQGPGFKSGLVTTLLGEQGLGVELELHMAGNAPASGAVESRHNWWQSSFEARLKHRDPPSLAELNRWATAWSAQRLASVPHSRHGRFPTEAWLDIRPDELVECPSREVYLRLATKPEGFGTLTNSRYLRIDNQFWEIRHPMAFAGMKVRYRISPFLEAGIRVFHPETGEEFAAIPSAKDKHGFMAGTSPILGSISEHEWDNAAKPGASHAPTPGQAIAAKVKAGELTAPAPDLFDDLPAQLARHDFLERTGKPWSPPGETPTVGEPILDSFAARDIVFAELGPPATPEEGRWWKARIGDGLPRSALNRLIAEATATQPAAKMAANQ